MYEQALNIWLSRKLGEFWAEDVREVKFGEGNWGYCETCDDPFQAVSVTIERNGKKEVHHLDLSGITPQQMISECLEIYKTISSINPAKFKE